MFVLIFVDLQGFLVGRHFVVKEFAALEDGFELSHFLLFLDSPNRGEISPKRKNIR